LLSRRSATQDWVPADVADHEAIAGAVEARDADAAAALMAAHVGSARRHWQVER
jgi:DNA-binding GntR family transcriptional regulator